MYILHSLVFVLFYIFFLDVLSIKIPFSFNDNEINNLSIPDTRIGGYGIFFSGILVICAICFIYLIIKIFNAIQYKTISNIKDDDELKLLYFKVEDNIKKLKLNNQTIKYDNIKFHEHAIKEYIKSQGMATITTSSTVEYYYKNTAENNEMSNLKKQTRYTCKFVYIYDENKIGNNRNSFSISCPNCGAPLIGIGNYVCEYCSSQITPINLKTWKMSSYKEDYK